MTQTVFLYGTLCHAPLLVAVLGSPAAGLRPAILRGYRAFWAAGEAFAVLCPAPQNPAPHDPAPHDPAPEGHTPEPPEQGGGEGPARVRGLLLEASPEQLQRLDYYEAGFAHDLLPVDCADTGACAVARVYTGDPERWPPGGAWRLEDWVARWGVLAVEAAQDIMAGFGQQPAAQVAARYPLALARAASRLRARAEDRASLRRSARPDDIAVEARRIPYQRFFAVEEVDLRFARFAGGFGPRVGWAGFVASDAVTVLPYDPARDRVMVIEQFRLGAWLRGAACPWLLEPIAGRIDAGETPEDAARREAREEAALALRALHAVAGYYPTPGGVSEYLYSYIALADLPDAAAGLGGLAAEAEDIRAHVIGFDRLLDLVATGEVDNGPLVLSALWLSRERDRLRLAG